MTKTLNDYLPSFAVNRASLSHPWPAHDIANSMFVAQQRHLYCTRPPLAQNRRRRRHYRFRCEWPSPALQGFPGKTLFLYDAKGEIHIRGQLKGTEGAVNNENVQ